MNDVKSITEEVKAAIANLSVNPTCQCKTNHLNCLSAKDWVKSMVGVWEFAYEKRDIRDKKIHPATFPISLAQKVIKLFSHRGELVVDLFSGSGTTLIAAQDLERNAVGFDLSNAYTQIAKERLGKNFGILQQMADNKWEQYAVNEDAMEASHYFLDQSIKLIFTSPPYANMLTRKRKNKSRRSDLRQNEQYGQIEQYSNDQRDLGTMECEEWAEKIGEILKRIHPKIKDNGHCVINVNDLWLDNNRYTLHSLLETKVNKVGYSLRNIIIWDKRNLVNRVGIFGYPSNYITMGATFEYILDFKKTD